jgi:hypothetical protein
LYGRDTFRRTKHVQRLKTYGTHGLDLKIWFLATVSREGDSGHFFTPDFFIFSHKEIGCTLDSLFRVNTMDNLSNQHHMPCVPHPPSKQVDEVLLTTVFDASCHLPAPEKFHKKAKCFERAAPADSTNITDTGIHTCRKSVLVSHRKYVHNLIIRTEKSDETNISHMWATCEGIFMD